MNNLYTREPAGRQAPGDSLATSAAAAMVPLKGREPDIKAKEPEVGP
jgi:hypothetical protein